MAPKEKKGLWKVKVFIDGASRGNPGPAGIGVVIKDMSGNIIKKHSEYIGDNKTNNQAEYIALIRALEICMGICRGEIFVFSDSELLIKQLHGRYRIKAPHLRKLLEEVKIKEQFFQRVEYSFIKRDRNNLADKLANMAIDDALMNGNGRDIY